MTRLQKLLRMPPHVLARKLWNRACTLHARRWARRRDQFKATYLRHEQVPAVLVDDYVIELSANDLAASVPVMDAFCTRYLKHEFNLLGSGWVQVSYGMTCNGFEGHTYPPGKCIRPDAQGSWLAGRINESNLKESQAIWRLVLDDYQPIDWHLDFISGYRWDEKIWYRDIRFATYRGTDIKVPWELSRMQHLPQMGVYYALIYDSHPQQAQALFQAFRNQILDFISTNPPRYGVNWACTMDVAIRVANWLVAYDLFRSRGAAIDNEFMRELTRSVYQHGRHIVENLEWNTVLNGNHYLADIAGLVLVAAHLSSCEETDDWLLFAIGQLVEQVQLQFHDDGGNFEGSTSYHRLASEMVVYATAIIAGLSDSRREALHRRLARWPEKQSFGPISMMRTKLKGAFPLPTSYWRRLRAIRDFSEQIVLSNGQVPQIGDNDNGRFLRMQPDVEYISGSSQIVLFEDPLRHESLQNAWMGIFGEPGQDTHGHRPERYIVRRLMKNRAPEGNTDSAKTVQLQQRRTWSSRQFGIYFWRQDAFELAVRCGPTGQNGNGGHDHNDQLSFVLHIRGVPIIVDCGTYIYTACPEARNVFRSAWSHNTLVAEGCRVDTFASGLRHLFRMSEQEIVKIDDYTAERFCGRRIFGTFEHRRTLVIKEREIHCVDECLSDSTKHLLFHLHPLVTARAGSSPGEVHLVRENTLQCVLAHDAQDWSIRPAWYSPGYGTKQESSCLSLRFGGPACTWKLKLEATT